MMRAVSLITDGITFDVSRSQHEGHSLDVVETADRVLSGASRLACYMMLSVQIDMKDVYVFYGRLIKS